MVVRVAVHRGAVLLVDLDGSELEARVPLAHKLDQQPGQVWAAQCLVADNHPVRSGVHHARAHHTSGPIPVGEHVLAAVVGGEIDLPQRPQHSLCGRACLRGTLAYIKHTPPTHLPARRIVWFGRGFTVSAVLFTAQYTDASIFFTHTPPPPPAPPSPKGHQPIDASLGVRHPCGSWCGSWCGAWCCPRCRPRCAF